MTAPIESLALCICGDPDCRVPYGLCHCGCGKDTSIASSTNSRVKRIKGRPVRFAVGHAAVKSRPDVLEMGHFKIGSVYCRLVALTNGQWAIVDEDDFDRVMTVTWYGRWDKTIQGVYAVANTYLPSGKRRTILMHRFILDLQMTKYPTVDHKDRLRTTENQRSNLRTVDESQSRINSRTCSRNTSGRKGVSKLRGYNIWLAYININKKFVLLGRFRSFEAACAAREAAELEHYGEYNCLD